MEVKLLNHTPLEVADIAICKCYSNKPHTSEDKRVKRIETVANQNKHASVIEHLTYNFDINGISRACLQELARHRIASYTVKSSRYTLQELKDEVLEIEQEICADDTVFVNFNRKIFEKYVVMTGNPYIDGAIALSLKALQSTIKEGHSNDVAKYCMPEAYKTSLVMTINARSLQNLLSLRTDKKALWEIQALAKAMYEVLPEQHKQLFIGSVK